MKTLKRCGRSFSHYMIERNCVWMFKLRSAIVRFKKRDFTTKQAAWYNIIRNVAYVIITPIKEIQAYKSMSSR